MSAIDGRRPALGGPRPRAPGVPLLLLHGFTGRGSSWGAARDRVRAPVPGHRRRPARATAARTRRRDPARASVERTAADLATILDRLAAPGPRRSATRWGRGSRSGWPSRTRGRCAGSCSRARPRASPTPAARAARARRRRGPRRDARDATASRPSSTAWEREPVFASHAAMPPAADRPPPRRAAAQPPGRPRREPARGRTGRHGAAPRPTRASVAAPTLVIAGALDPAGRRSGRRTIAAGDPGRPPRGHRRRRPRPAPRDPERVPFARHRLPGGGPTPHDRRRHLDIASSTTRTSATSTPGPASPGSRSTGRRSTTPSGPRPSRR